MMEPDMEVAALELKRYELRGELRAIQGEVAALDVAIGVYRDEIQRALSSAASHPEAEQAVKDLRARRLECVGVMSKLFLELSRLPWRGV